MRDMKLDHVPRHKFQFWVRFVKTTQDVQGTELSSRWPNGVSFKVHNVERPRISFKNMVANQYNKKRVVQSGVEYQPISIKFYDTYNDEVLRFVQEYTQFYYGDFNNPASSAWRHDIVDAEMEKGVGVWGMYHNPSEEADNSYFFDKIEIYSFGNGEFTRWDIVKPKMIDISPDAFDYSDGNTPSELSITFAYEGVIWPEMKADIEDEIEKMGLDQSEVAEVNVDAIKFPVTAEKTASNATNELVKEAYKKQAEELEKYLSNADTSSASKFDLNGLLQRINSSDNVLGLNFGQLIQTNLNKALEGVTTSTLESIVSGLPKLASNISSILPAGLNSAIPNLVSRLSGLQGNLSGMVSNLKNIIPNISQLRSPNISSAISSILPSFGNIGSLFSGFFDGEEQVTSNRLALPITESQYLIYNQVVLQSKALSDEMRTLYTFNMLPLSIKEAITAIEKLNSQVGMVRVGETQESQLVEKMTSLSTYLMLLYNFSIKTNTRASKSNAVYETTMGHINAIGITDSTLSSAIVAQQMIHNVSQRNNTTNYNEPISAEMFASMNLELGPTMQVGTKSNQILSPTRGLNSAQRALRKQVDDNE